MSKKLSFNNKTILFFVAVLLTNLLIGVVVLAKVNVSLNQNIVDIKEMQRPADLDIIVIKNSACKECFNLVESINILKNYNINILSEEVVEYDSNLGQKLIVDNNIKSVPAFFIKGELTKDSEVEKMLSQLGNINGDTFVSTRTPAPYFLLDSEQVIGKVNITMLTDDTCSECYNVEDHKNIMNNFGVYLANEESFSIQTSRGQQLMNKYNIKLLPTIILTGEVDVYTSLKSIWSKVGSEESDGAFILREGVKGMGVYKDMTNNQIVDSRSSAKN